MYDWIKPTPYAMRLSRDRKMIKPECQAKTVQCSTETAKIEYTAESEGTQTQNSNQMMLGSDADCARKKELMTQPTSLQHKPVKYPMTTTDTLHPVTYCIASPVSVKMQQERQLLS